MHVCTNLDYYLLTLQANTDTDIPTNNKVGD